MILLLGTLNIIEAAGRKNQLNRRNKLVWQEHCHIRRTLELHGTSQGLKRKVSAGSAETQIDTLSEEAYPV